MSNNATLQPPGLSVTFPYKDETGQIERAIARAQCDECGKWERSDKGYIRHSKNCESKVQYVVPKTPAAQLDREIAESIRDQELKTFASNVRRTGHTKGRDQDVLDAVRRGYLSESEAMNSDD